MQSNRRIGREIRIVDNLLRRRFVRDLKRIAGNDVTVIQVWILKYISDSEPDDIFQKDIEKEFEIAKSTATSTLKLMERKELITRVQVPYDERLKKLCLTDKGRRITQEMWESARTADNELVKDIDDKRLEVFYSVLDEIKKKCGDADIEKE